jgi:hypothetical protein
LIDEDNEGIFGIGVSNARGIFLDRIPGPPAGLENQLVPIEEGFAHLNGFLKQTARISAQIQDQSFQLCRVHLLESVLKFLTRRFGKAVDLDVPHIGSNHVREVDRVFPEVLADDIQFESLVFSRPLDRYMHACSRHASKFRDDFFDLQALE